VPTAGDADRASGILFNVKPNGEWLALRYYDAENNVALWEFHNGIRRNSNFSDREKPFPLDRAARHELKLVADGASVKGYLNGALAVEYTLGVDPVAGQVGLWSKTDSTVYFKDYVISAKPQV
jgi:hypothetical protein